ncbi:cbb3-type cytochrome c oxidase subunit I [Streptomyces mirabilis]|uniref:cbb3-type cytochrome c oxidase subunit I n=1 Tax=Streptomyces mirabilis TaxID=68239 RepID=UPI0036A983EE
MSRPLAETERFPKGARPTGAAPSYEIQLTREYERPDPFVWFDGGRTGSSLFAAVLLHVVGQRAEALQGVPLPESNSSVGVQRSARACRRPRQNSWSRAQERPYDSRRGTGRCAPFVPESRRLRHLVSTLSERDIRCGARNGQWCLTAGSPPRRDAALPNRMPGVHLPPQTSARAQYGSPVAGRYERAVRQADYRANWITPLQIGAPDVAFARLNMFACWLYLFGSLIVLPRFLTPGGPAAWGWTGYTPPARSAAFARSRRRSVPEASPAYCWLRRPLNSMCPTPTSP